MPTAATTAESLLTAAERVNPHHTAAIMSSSSCGGRLAFRLILILQLMAYVEGRMIFQRFNPPLPCADGTPAGLYMEEEEYIGSSPTDPSKQLLVFIGGGACTSPSDCLKGYEQEPFKFSSEFNPVVIQGDTILSTDPSLNAMHTYRKTLVPYCSQDFFLGASRTIQNFTHAGSAHMEAAIDTWSEYVLATAASPIEIVVLVGLSAGALGILNHMELIRDAIDAPFLRVVLDSPTVLSDRPYKDKDFREFVGTYVDVDKYPFCDPMHIYSRLYTRASALPCCLSPYCMLRHHPSWLSLYEQRDSISQTTDVLLLDSAYDTFSLLAGTSLENDEDEGASTRQEINDIWSMIETGGARKMRSAETTAIAKLSLTPELSGLNKTDDPRVRWLFSSCVTHTFLVPAREFLFLSCDHGDYEGESFDIVCNDHGFAMEFELEDLNLHIRFWRTVETWKQADFQGRSMRDIIQSFVTVDTPSQDFPMLSVFGEEALDIRLEECAGPNCLPLYQPDTDQPSCHALVELDSSFQPLSPGYQVFLFLCLVVPLVLSMCFRLVASRKSRRLFTDARKKLTYSEADRNGSLKTDDDTPRTRARTRSSIRKSALNLQGIQVDAVDPRGKTQNIIHNADLNLRVGTVTAICGRCGSGKSTLLKSISHQRGYRITIQGGEDSLSRMSVAFLRQGDELTCWDSLTSYELLLLNSSTYGASRENTSELMDLLSQLLYSNSKQENPFFSTPVGKLSGGQKRLLSTASTLLMNTGILLLDEPLSGLDAFTSLELVQALKTIAFVRSTIIMMVAHQPSERILAGFDQIVIMDSGKTLYRCEPKSSVIAIEDAMGLLMDTSLENIEEALAALDQKGATKASRKGQKSPRRGRARDNSQPRDDDDKHFVNGIKKPKKKKKKEGDRQEQSNGSVPSKTSKKKTKMSKKDMTETSNDTSTRVETTHSNQVSAHHDGQANTLLNGFPNGKADIPQSCAPRRAWMDQSLAILLRLHMEHGWQATDILLVTAMYVLMASLLIFEDVYTMRVLLMGIAMISMPTVIFAVKSVQFAKIWTGHRLELDDRLIDPVPFQIATMVFYFAIPVVAIFTATIPVFWILGWSFHIYLALVLFTTVHLLVTLQLGRVIAVYSRGNIGKVVTLLTFFFLFTLLFSSFLVASWKLPPFLRWLLLCSVNFWGFSGAVMTLFDVGYYDNAEFCSDFVNCLLSDGRFIVQFLGFSQLTNQVLSMTILLVLWLVLVGVEYQLLCLRRR